MALNARDALLFVAVQAVVALEKMGGATPFTKYGKAIKVQ